MSILSRNRGAVGRGTASTGGLTALAMNKYFRARNRTQKNNSSLNSSELKAKENAS